MSDENPYISMIPMIYDKLNEITSNVQSVLKIFDLFVESFEAINKKKSQANSETMEKANHEQGDFTILQWVTAYAGDTFIFQNFSKQIQTNCIIPLKNFAEEIENYVAYIHQHLSDEDNKLSNKETEYNNTYKTYIDLCKKIDSEAHPQNSQTVLESCTKLEKQCISMCSELSRFRKQYAYQVELLFTKVEVYNTEYYKKMLQANEALITAYKELMKDSKNMNVEEMKHHDAMQYVYDNDQQQQQRMRQRMLSLKNQVDLSNLNIFKYLDPHEVYKKLLLVKSFIAKDDVYDLEHHSLICLRGEIVNFVNVDEDRFIVENVMTRLRGAVNSKYLTVLSYKKAVMKLKTAFTHENIEFPPGFCFCSIYEDNENNMFCFNHFGTPISIPSNLLEPA